MEGRKKQRHNWKIFSDDERDDKSGDNIRPDQQYTHRKTNKEPLIEFQQAEVRLSDALGDLTKYWCLGGHPQQVIDLKKENRRTSKRESTKRKFYECKSSIQAEMSGEQSFIHLLKRTLNLRKAHNLNIGGSA